MNKIKDLTAKVKELKKEIEKGRVSFLNPIAKSIKNRRKDLGLNQEKLAELTGLSRTQITNIELGNSYPSMKNFIMLCLMLDITPNEMLR